MRVLMVSASIRFLSPSQDTHPLLCLRNECHCLDAALASPRSSGEGTSASGGFRWSEKRLNAASGTKNTFPFWTISLVFGGA